MCCVFQALVTLVKQLKSNNQDLIFLNIKQELISVCADIGSKEMVYCFSKDYLEDILFCKF